MKAAIFVRVSGKGQDYDRQIADLRKAAKLKGYAVAEVITEKASGSRKTKDRPAFQKLLSLAHDGYVNAVLVTEVTRLGRNTREVINAVEDLSESGVNIHLQGYNLDTIVNGKRNPVAQLLVTLLAEIGRLEREFLVERTRSGLQQAKRLGKKLGRPFGTTKPADQFLDENKRAVKLLKKGRSIREVSKISGISINTALKVRRLMKDIK